jgi:hypothetical protein
MYSARSLNHLLGVTALTAAATLSVVQEARAFDSADAVLTGLAIGSVVAVSHGRHHHHSHRHHYQSYGATYHTRPHYWHEPRPYCPPRRTTVVTEYPRWDGPQSGWSQPWGSGVPDYGRPQNGWGGYGGAHGYGSVSGYGGYQRRVEINRW